MNTTTNSYDESNNHDLPGEIHEWTEDPADRQYHDARSALDSMTLPSEIEDLHDGNCEVMIVDDPYTDAPAGDEDWRDPEVWDNEDDSWSDSDSLASCGWGEDEAYGCFE